MLVDDISQTWQKWQNHSLYPLWQTQLQAFSLSFLHYLENEPNALILHGNPFLLKDFTEIHKDYHTANMQKIYHTPMIGLANYEDELTRTECFEGIFLPHVLENVPNYIKHLNIAKHLTRVGGYIGILCFNPWSLWRAYNYLSHQHLPVTSDYPNYYSLQQYISAKRNWQIIHAQFFAYDLPKIPINLNAIGDRWFAHLGGMYGLILQNQAPAFQKMRFSKKRLNYTWQIQKTVHQNSTKI